MTIAPEAPSSAVTSGKAAASTSSLSLWAVRMQNEPWAGWPDLDRLRQRDLVELERLFTVRERPERRRPLLGRHLPCLLERAAKERCRSLVVEDHRPSAVDQEGRGRDARQEVPGEDQFEWLLRGSHELRLEVRPLCHRSRPIGTALPRSLRAENLESCEIRLDESPNVQGSSAARALPIAFLMLSRERDQHGAELQAARNADRRARGRSSAASPAATR